MPVDDDGNRADVIADPNSTISRMNLGRVYEQHMNACSRDVRKRIRQTLGLGEKDKVTIESLQGYGSETVNDVWEYLKGFYKIISPLRMYEKFALVINQQQIHEHLVSCINEWIYVYLPPENETESIEVVKQLEEYVQPTRTPVTYTGNSGKRIRTKENVRIGSMYYILLEKIGDDGTAVSSAKLQNYGVLSQITNADKYSQPIRQQAIRAVGESELRILRSYTGSIAPAEIIDRNNSPETHYAVLESILGNDNPAVIPNAVNRRKIPYGGSKPLKLFKHYAFCGGWRVKYSKHDPNKNIFGVKS